MCGFVGAFDTDLSPERIQEAACLLAHRGPDGCAVTQVGPFCIAAHRLAIVPPNDAPPIHQEEDRILVLNGEVYGLPPVPSTAPTTDTARLDKVLHERGVAALPHLRGMFALCRYDCDGLLLARDRFGIKPLFYARYGRGLVFASEMKPLLSLPAVSRDPDPDVDAAFRVVGHNVLPGRTPFLAIQALRPGFRLSFSPGCGPVEASFAQVARVAPAGTGLREDLALVAARVHDLLAAAVARALDHDPHRKALFFSGGLDSSLLLALTAREHGLAAHVLTDRDDADDLLEARRVAAAMMAPLTEHRVDSKALDREIVHFAWHFERPLAGGTFDLFGGVAFHCLARRIAERGRVAFCGEGADELFLGYHRVHMQPDLTVAALSQRAEAHATPDVHAWMNDHDIKVSVPAPARARALRDLALHEGLSEYHLPSVDCSGMAFGLEIRPPYLDEDLVDYVVALDESVLIDRVDRWTKRPLREIVSTHFVRDGLERLAVRRKRAMAAAVERSANELASSLAPGPNGQPDLASLEDLLHSLFIYLHVEPGLTSCPDFSLSGFAAATSDRRRPP